MSSWLQIPEALISPSKTGEDPTIAKCPFLSGNRQDERPLQDLPENPPQTDRLEKDQGTELLIPTENIVYIKNKAPDNDLTSNSDTHFVHSAKSSQLFCPNQDNTQTDTAVQAPFDLNITLPAMFPSTQYTGEDDSEEFKNHRENDEMRSGERRVAQLQDQTSVTMEVDNTESSLHELQEFTQQCSLNELITASASKNKGDFSHSTGHDILFEESHEPLLEKPEMHMIKHDTVVKRETSGKEQAGLRVGEVPDMIASYMRQPFEPTNLGQIGEDDVIQNVPSPPKTPDPEITEYQQGQGPEPELEVPEVLSVNVNTTSGSESAALKEESPLLTSLYSATATSQSLTTTVQAVAPEGGDGEPSMTQEEPLSYEKFELYYNNPASFQKQEGLESQPALPWKNLEASNAEVDVILSKTLIPSFAFLSAAVCLIVGFHEPNIFLIMVLFLVSLCF